MAHGRVQRAVLQWSPTGLLVVPGGPLDEVGEIAFQRPAALARSLWRLLALGPRPESDTLRPSAGPLDPGELLAPFTGRPVLWLQSLDVANATLSRVDVRVGDGPPLASLAMVDSAAGLWEITGDGDDGFHVRPTRPTSMFTVFAGWQRSLIPARPRPHLPGLA